MNLMKHKIASVHFAGLFIVTDNHYDASAHRSEIQKWQSDRLASLTKEDGWLTLIGLFWLNEGENKFGSDPKNAIVAAKGQSARRRRITLAGERSRAIGSSS